MHIKIATGIVLLTGLLGNAYAATCPTVASIEQTPLSTGFEYSADGGWKGSNEEGLENDLKSFKFTAAAIRKNYVSCSYEGEGPFAGVRLSRQIEAKANDSGSWRDNICLQSNPAECAFD
ncbi:DUF3757 domain-containing protein [Pseudomonas aegrilactucae]|uniref:DUF3757 domain-containing protein n=1 Tax=Pseudomonas aegrilactucae TaxID=2854028 RepID=A0A9Q3AET9_9PSED|nr:DUF3757 domain-containing protein [Pseudomonas aegrilactucae]MBV6288859.1 DUF3757 domain-containing protein [Pseudomonas aegrilactucae]